MVFLCEIKITNENKLTQKSAAANCDHLNHIKSIYSGFAKRSTPAFLLHISGSGILVDKSSVSPGLGSQSKISDKDYDDIADIKTITSWPDHFMHRTIDREVLENAPKNVKQLIVCPPCIYGRGTGPLNQTSMQVPGYITAILKRGKGFILQEGKNVWSAIHVVDLAKLMCLLTEEAMKPNGGSATWGSEAYYFASSEKIVWGELAKDITKRLYRKGAVKSEELEVIEKSELGEIDKMTLDLCGSNSKSTASRGKRDVGWAPKQAGVVDSLDEAIQMVLIKDN